MEPDSGPCGTTGANVFNACAKRNAHQGESIVTVSDGQICVKEAYDQDTNECKRCFDGNGVAVYSPEAGSFIPYDVCPEFTDASVKCYCTAFNAESIDKVSGGDSGGTLPSMSFPADKTVLSGYSSPSRGDGVAYKTYCVGDCGVDCTGGKAYAALVIHDLCQASIGATKAWPAMNHCDDEGANGISSAVEDIATYVTDGGACGVVSTSRRRRRRSSNRRRRRRWF